MVSAVDTMTVEMTDDAILLSLVSIASDGATQPRAQISESVVSDYAEDMRNGAKFPPVVVFYDGTNYWLADGFHRCAAADAAGLESVLAEVRQGTQRQAILHSVGANGNHGFRRSNADKRRAVTTLLNDEEWSAWSDTEIARRCGVTHPFVAGLRPKVSCNNSKIDPTAPATRKVTRNGKTYEMDTSKIGATKSSAARRPARKKSPIESIPFLSPSYVAPPDNALNVQNAQKRLRVVSQFSRDFADIVMLNDQNQEIGNYAVVDSDVLPTFEYTYRLLHEDIGRHLAWVREEMERRDVSPRH